MERISDAELERIAAIEGPDSMAARALEQLRTQRAKDKQVVAFRFANSYAVGPQPDAQSQLSLSMIELAVVKPRTETT
jgi:hypothetical protein